MPVIKIKDKGLTGYYLENKFHDEPESGLRFVEGSRSDKIELHYEDDSDLSNKLSYILMILTDK